ncbi:class I SAM-dependent methyltransferase [Rugosimonospora africana]|uniref:Methyltransferase n=1 Tax=Rugosimonospora africana TaxID=556532 RepID=A0A8J3QZC3_9ACTN|nr:methyltransferase domain-containing protein [Rugosimonospora africana]GIH18827.1 methyltransferase [Rugosimonospora africana]
MDETLLPAAGYPFSNEHDRSPDHHDALADLFDDATSRCVSALLPVLSGLRIAEVAAGGGSMAHRFADAVAGGGPAGDGLAEDGLVDGGLAEGGLVVATDVNPALIREHPRVLPRAHDITVGPVPDGPFDLVHARALCNWLIDPRAAVANMILSLIPGGWVLTEDMVPVGVDTFVIEAPTADDAALLRRFEAAYLGALAERGNEQVWPSRAEAVFRGLGLREVRTSVYQTPWPGGGPGCRMLSAASAQVRAPMMRAGLTAAELERADRLLHDPAVVVAGHALHSTSGQLAGPARGRQG